MSHPLHIDISDLAKAQVRAARARNIALSGVRRVNLARVRYHVYYRALADPETDRDPGAFWHTSRGGTPPL